MLESPPSESSSSSLTTLFDRVFRQASASAPSSSSVDSLLSLIRQARSQAQSLSLISSNDTVDDLPTSSLRAVLLDSIYAQSLYRLNTRPGDFEARKDVLNQANTAFRAYLSLLGSLKVLDSDRPRSSSYQSMLAAQSKNAVDKSVSPFPVDASSRRAAKIAGVKLESALKTALKEYREAARAKAKSNGAVRSTGIGWSSESNGMASTSSTGLGEEELEVEFDVLTLAKGQTEDDDDDDDGEEDEAFVGGRQTHDMEVQTPSSLRSYLIMLCHLHALLAFQSLDSIQSELTLLASMPSNAQSLSRERAGRERDEMERRQNEGEGDEWRLDQRWGASNSAPLLDDKGKPNRPFTILPSGSTANNGQAFMGASATQNQMDARQRLREGVFQPSHRLPTMSIDEYLQEEERRGNIISGGGQASAEAPTTSELLALRSQGQGVGTREAEEAEEKQRRKADEWDDFAENNPKGMGNTMNRG